MARKYWWEDPHHVIASACLRSLTQDVGRASLSNEAATKRLLRIFGDSTHANQSSVPQWCSSVSRPPPRCRLLGPVAKALQKARNADWADKAGQRVERVVASLRQHYRQKTVTDPPKPEQLHEQGIIDGASLAFLTDRRVTDYPFVTADADPSISLVMRIPPSFLNDASTERVRKERITAPD